MVEIPENLKIKTELVNKIQHELEDFAQSQFKEGEIGSVFTIIRTLTLQFCDLYEAQHGLSLEAMLRFFSWLCVTCSPDYLDGDKNKLVAQWVNGFLETFFCWSSKGTLAAVNHFIDRSEIQEQLKEGVFARLKKTSKPQK